MNEITIKASDGTFFKGTVDTYWNLLSELNAYETNLKLKKEQEEAEKTESIKAFKEIEDLITQLNAAVKEYELASGVSTYYTQTTDGKLKVGTYTEITGDLIKRFFQI